MGTLPIHRTNCTRVTGPPTADGLRVSRATGASPVREATSATFLRARCCSSPPRGDHPSSCMTRTAVHRSPVWSKDGRRLYFVSNRQGPSDIYSIEVTEAGAVRGDPVRVTTGLGVYSIAFSSDRRQLAYAAYSNRSNIWSVRLPSQGTVDLSSGRAVTSGNQTIEAMRVTRDGRWLLYDSNLHGNFDIFRLALSDGRIERLTDGPGDEFAPDLSPDGRSLAYHSWRTMSRDIFVKRLDGPRLDQVTATPSQESFPAWSPDGRSLAFLDQFVEDGVARGAFLVQTRSRRGLGRTSIPSRRHVESVLVAGWTFPYLCGPWKCRGSPDRLSCAGSRVRTCHARGRSRSPVSTVRA